MKCPTCHTEYRPTSELKKTIDEDCTKLLTNLDDSRRLFNIILERLIGDGQEADKDKEQDITLSSEKNDKGHEVSDLSLYYIGRQPAD